MSASGVFVPPMMIFPRKTMNTTLLKGAPEGTVGFPSPNGWIDKNLFIEWMHHIIKHVKPTPDDIHLIVMDGHNSHKSLELIDLARANGVEILILPPHTTHRLQPLDAVFFKPLTDNYNIAADHWMVSNAGKRISFYEIASLFCTAYQKTATIAKASSAFRCTGIWPFNPDVFDSNVFAPSSVTDRPLNADSAAADGSQQREQHFTVPATATTRVPTTTTAVPDRSFIAADLGMNNAENCPDVGDNQRQSDATSSSTVVTNINSGIDTSTNEGNSESSTSANSATGNAFIRRSSVARKVVGKELTAYRDDLLKLSPLPTAMFTSTRKRKSTG